MSDEMEMDEAFVMLGLSTGASPEEIRSSYHARAKCAHPDNPGGDAAEFKRLAEAKNIALAYAQGRGAIVAVSAAGLSRSLCQVLAMASGVSAAEKSRALARRVSRIPNTTKWLLWVFGMLSAGLAFLKEATGLPAATTQADASMNTQLRALLVLLAFMCGAFGGILQVLVTFLERCVESFTERISDKRECAAALAASLGYKDRPYVKECDLAYRVNVGMPHLMRPFRYMLDVRAILIAKAVEYGLLAPVESEKVTPDFDQDFRVLFKPSVFGPRSQAGEKSATRDEGLR